MLLMTLGDDLRYQIVDLHDNFEYYRDPRQVIRAADLALYGWVDPLTDMYYDGRVRPVMLHSTSSTGVRTSYYLELVPYIHPSAAAALTLGTLSGDTYTPVNNGFLVAEDGTIIATGSNPKLIAGQLLSRYYYNPGDDRMGAQQGMCIQLAKGDMCWVIRNGHTFLPYSAAPNAGDPLQVSGATAGKVVAAGALNTGGTIADYNTSLLGRINRRALTNGLALGEALANGSGNWVEAQLELPARWTHTTT